MIMESSPLIERSPCPELAAATRCERVGRETIEYATMGALATDQPTLVFLHEGLGCLAMWRDFPARVADALGLAAVVSSRRGYGGSETFTAPFTTRFMHDEARQALPALLAHLGIRRAILVGHSDGASIALLHAAGAAPAGDSGSAPTIAAVVAIAPHLFVEPVCIESIAATAAAFPDGRLARALGRYHRDPHLTFSTWSDIWLAPEFLAWNIEAEVAQVRCPVLALQGTEDQYGTLRQIERVAELAPNARAVAIPGARHSPHLEQPERTASEIVAFLGALRERAE